MMMIRINTSGRDGPAAPALERVAAPSQPGPQVPAAGPAGGPDRPGTGRPAPPALRLDKANLKPDSNNHGDCRLYFQVHANLNLNLTFSDLQWTACNGSFRLVTWHVGRTCRAVGNTFGTGPTGARARGLSHIRPKAVHSLSVRQRRQAPGRGRQAAGHDFRVTCSAFQLAMGPT